MKKATEKVTCCKCGAGRWLGPHYVTLNDELGYVCGQCGYVRFELPLDRWSAPKKDPR